MYTHAHHDGVRKVFEALKVDVQQIPIDILEEYIKLYLHVYYNNHIKLPVIVFVCILYYRHTRELIILY